MIGCLILSHGKLAEAYLDASRQIVGECQNLYALNCENLTPKGLHERITHLIESEDLKDGLFILVSLRGGSCWNVAARIVREYENIQLLSGVNLSVILSFITKQDQYNFREFGEVLLRDGQRGISCLNGSR